MKYWKLFLIMSAIYLSPRLPDAGAVSLGAIFVVSFFIALLRGR